MAGLYLHIPFCERKCPYCDFYSFAATPDEVLEYPELLRQHMARAAGQQHDFKIESIYFGGGTPSLLEPEAINTILEQAHLSFDIADAPEVSLEVNPGTASLDKLQGYRSAGINRLSLGLQSCHNDRLADLGRIHTLRDNLECVEHARKAGFDNLSLDLMFALPAQGLAELEEELTRYLELCPEHLSCYGLTAEPGTLLYQQIENNERSLPGDGAYADAYQLIHEQLCAAGYEHYEIANYARAGRRCRHNEGYWRRQPYLGIGAGAHSFFSEGWGSRWQVPDDLDRYRQALQDNQAPAVELESFDRESALRESIYLAMRTRRGVIDEELRSDFDCTLADAFPEAVRACSPWLDNKAGRWTFNLDGWLIYDRLIQHFL